MQRRAFLRTGLASAALATIATPRLLASAAPQEAPTPHPDFQLAYAPHLGMFRHLAGDDPVAQIDFMADQGFTAFEDNGMKGRSIETQDAIAKALDRHGMRMGVFVAHSELWRVPSFTSGKAEHVEQFVKDLEGSVEVAKRVHATWMTVVPGELDPRQELDFQTANAIDMLRRGAEVLEPHEQVMVLEPLNPFRDHPRMFLSKVPHAYLLCRAVNSPACKILFDIYHQQITEGNLIPNIDRAWDEIGYIQVGDTPGRKEPGTGEIHYRNVFRHLHAKGFTGIVGMEHGNSRPGPEGEQAVIDAYRWADDF